MIFVSAGLIIGIDLKIRKFKGVYYDETGYDSNS